MKRVFDWAGIAVVLTMVAKLYATAMQPIDNADVFFHLRLGRDLGWPWQWLSVDHWSPLATSEWVPTQPLPEVIQALAERVGGLPLVAWLFGLTLVALVMAIYWVARRYGTPMAAGFAVALAVVGASASLSPRPQVLSLILLLPVVHAWLRTGSDLKPRWWLVPLFWLWAMTHGFWVVGLSVGFGMTAALIVFRRARGRDAIRLLGLCAATGVATALTPVGPKVLLGPIWVRERTALIGEWQSGFGHVSDWFALTAVLMPVVILAGSRRLTLPIGSLLAISAFWLFYSARTADVASVMAVPGVALAIDALRRERSVPVRGERVTLAGACALMLGALALTVPHSAQHEGDKMPRGLDTQLAALPDDTVVFNSGPLGAWLAWKYPNIDDTLDALLDAYPVTYLEATLDALNGEPGWESTVAKTGATYALLDEEGSLAPKLRAVGWREIGRDAGYVLLKK